MAKQYNQILDSLQEEYQRKIQELAAEYRESVLLPLCKKRKLCFISGMGEFYFYPASDDGTRFGSSWTAGDVDDAILECKRYLIPFLEVLNQEVERDQYFGFYVDDIRKEDLE